MPIQKKKVKKDKNEAKPAGIKQEPEELKPLAEYIDDRLELIRQVFSCVKPKEINYLLPDFLEGKSNDIIKERCLDELLGISTKRLRSIINNTKCPTDTESDSENSDLEKIEEHISLDEISSDSDADGKRSGKSGGANKRKANAENSKSADERNGGDAKSEKEMTVLELLELQARARAIRSQLALEPVTKIEIDSEHEDEDARQADVDTDEETNRVTRKRASPKTVASSSVENGKQPKTENSSSTEQQPRRVRLKRNFRVRQAGDDDSDADEVSSNATDKLPSRVASEPEPGPEPKQAETVEAATEKAVSVEAEKESDEPKDVEKVGEPTEPVPTATPAVVEKSSDVVADADMTATKEVTTTPAPGTSPVPVADSSSVPVADEENVAVEEQNKQPVTARDADRESSPEVIPVEASPETLCISSDSEEERLAKQRASIFVDNIEELDRQAKETVPDQPEKPADEDDEPEEGEISEEEEEEPPAPAVEESVPPESAPEIESSKGAEGAGENASDELIAADDKHDGGDSATSGNPDAQPAPENTSAATEEVQLLSSGSDESGSESSGDSGSGSSSSSDSEADENGEKKKKASDLTPKLDPAHDDADIVEIHDSGDEKLLLDEKPSEPENPEEKSWNSRWLKSNRVAKVMAASRLGNKVREKLKKKKQIQQAEQQQQQQQQQPQPDTEGTDSTKQLPATENQQAESAVPSEQPSNVEVGSVEHYRELVAQQETKD
ncbi:nucleolar and coiled-body phosphoprotein 1-like [Anopheles albimanus]|uniref:Microtubule-associated protein futsch n=1 Tax=Anopheles albimanus TaxID=7167 RepID=A0A8W7JW56_ANOAL|nr:nucleolar and coiled-body phosphoprotein 1-like [Anopheles albimanus]